MDKKDRDREDEAAPFNMALATLQRVNEILRAITETSMMMSDYPVMCLMKFKLTKQLYAASIPLLESKEKKDELKKEVDGLNKLFFEKINEVIHTKELGCAEGAELKIDEVINHIQEALQIDKYFMPSKADPSRGWKQY